MEFDQLFQEIQERKKQDAERYYRTRHVRQRATERAGLYLRQADIDEIECDIRNGLGQSFGVYFRSTRKYDDYYRVFLGGKELIVIYKDGKVSTIMPENIKQKMNRLLQLECSSREIQII